MSAAALTAASCRSPHGERGLKFVRGLRLVERLGRSPHGERGLKFEPVGVLGGLVGSLSSWRAWIEITGAGSHDREMAVALLMESVD